MSLYNPRLLASPSANVAPLRAKAYPDSSRPSVGVCRDVHLPDHPRGYRAGLWQRLPIRRTYE